MDLKRSGEFATRDMLLREEYLVCYGTHCDGRSHTGYIITLGESRSFVHARSCKQKLTTLSSTDAEIYAATTASTNITWLASLIDELGGHQDQEGVLGVMK
eukprot:gene4965-5451_t